ncbi:uncharacterized protein AMSG_08119 [Thecamonas trahens ATCC 50062]|uniref:HhH-GPD domain-containing protein n=1 Tax=Thecamonas trahens ATCC 50062 TaxID=461836 RepID=A0A0L0DJS6_THETB|nr:hypothetical protein AMSG_08119 [Thecamonas trahens ATCC 50062]KNC52552.1 hypothetical protein AMSG_08119 [Thecamonas trahens ATCC 50062]|eukprot:XP_013755342.1 hypothetical protein AMSG_08119 [Thecamonas trahens ATCC 50062]
MAGRAKSVRASGGSADSALEGMSATAFGKMKVAKKRKLLAQLDLHDELTDELEADVMAAVAFTRETHGEDVRRMDARSELIVSFDDFYTEYAYVVVASGFRAEFAARIVPALVAAAPDEAAMIALFKNRAKIAALVKVYGMRSEWETLRASFRTPDDLTVLPRIGPVVKFHLARNIGLKSCVKPDVHMMAYAAKRGWHSPIDMVEALAAAYHLPIGTLDFCLWVWMSHGFGSATSKCCHGGYELR